MPMLSASAACNGAIGRDHVVVRPGSQIGDGVSRGNPVITACAIRRIVEPEARCAGSVVERARTVAPGEALETC